jgi:MAF protein
MRQIYLASDSKARKKLLKILGLKFKVFPSVSKEQRHRGTLSYATLAKKNALAKARNAAGKLKKGIIIAADTFVVQEGKIFGKPKDLKEARLMLKRLSRKPHKLYTGIAIIDKDKNKILLDYEKTKIYMDKLSDEEIGRYFARVSPLDKAGGFDIQGKGAFFIRRIEGCFYNIVGLPIHKLYRMLKKIGINIFITSFFALSFAFCAFLSGCLTEYNVVTGKEEAFIYSTDKEEQIGRNIAKQVEEEYKIVEDPLIQQRVKDVGRKIVSVCDRKDIDYEFKVIDDDEINAVSLPGGFVYVNKGLVDRLENDDELAGVLGHEIGHIVARHSIKKLQGIQGYSLLRILIAQVPGSSSQIGAAADTAFTELMLGYSREDELLADQLAARYMRLAGYEPHAMIKFLERLQDINRRKPSRAINYFKTHPYVPDRIRVVKEELGEKIDFNDYINIEQTPHE